MNALKCIMNCNTEGNTKQHGTQGIMHDLSFVHTLTKEQKERLHCFSVHCPKHGA